MSRLLIPNSTQIPDVILDSWIAELSGGEFKVLLYIARRTYGFGKDRDGISLTQLAQGPGGPGRHRPPDEPLRERPRVRGEHLQHQPELGAERGGGRAGGADPFC